MVTGRILSFVLIVLSYGALGWLSGRSQVEWRNVVGHRVVLSMYGTDGNTVPLSTQRIRRMQEIVTLQEKNLRGIDAVSIIKYCFEDFTDIRHILPLGRLAEIIQTCQQELDVHKLSEAIAGLADLSSDEPEVRSLVATLTKCLASCEDRDFTASDIAHCLTGLQCMSCRYKEVRMLVALCTAKLTEGNLKMGCTDVANAIYGLQGMNADSEEVVALLDALTHQLGASDEPVTSHALNLFGYGMQRMSSDSETVARFVMVLTIKVGRSNTIYSGQALVNGLFLMRSMTSESSEVLGWVELLTAKINDSTRSLKSYMLARALSGMQGLSSDAPEVRRLSSALAKKVLKGVVDIDDEMSAADMGKSFLGFRRMQSAYPEVRRLLGALVFKCLLSKKPLNAKTVGTILIGLNGMDRLAPEVQYTLQMLHKKVEKSSKMDFQEKGMATHGIQGNDAENPICVFEALGITYGQKVY